MVGIHEVTFRYEAAQETLSEINLEIGRGECVLLCGSSGCGKTTVTKLINGLIPHFVEGGILSGYTEVGGHNVAETEMYELSEQVGSVFQNPKSQFFHLDSDSEIVFGLENAGLAPEKIRQRLQATVEALQIDYLLGRSIFSMSGGEKQMLAFASVYAMNPPVFVLDEPTANLDAAAIELLREQIKRIKAEGRTVIVAEHRLYFLRDLIDRAVYLRNGQIEQIWSGEEFQTLSEAQRIQLGLRGLHLPEFKCSLAKPPGDREGLSVQGLCCTFGQHLVFSEVGFSAQPGEILGIVGQNGAGKTTLTRCLCGLVQEKSGVVSLAGHPLKAKERQKACFCVMQDVDHQLFSDSVWNECVMTKPDCPAERIQEILQAFDLLELQERHPMALSGGQKQRLAVATAILSDKKVLIFDEPTSGLDYQRMMEVSNLICRLKEAGKILLIVSHDVEFMAKTCDSVLLMAGSAAERGDGYVGVISAY